MAFHVPNLVVDAAPCFLCQDHKQMPRRKDCILDPDTGLTCFHLYTELLFSDNWGECVKNRTAYQDACCGDDTESICYTGPTAAPVYHGETGDEPTCKICGTDEYPGKPEHVFSTRYVGTYSCGEYYDRGLHGLIPGYLCGPLQDYASEACGCGEHNPECVEDPAKCYDYSPPNKPNIDAIHDSVNGTVSNKGLGVVVACCVSVGLAVGLVFYMERRRRSRAADIVPVRAEDPDMLDQSQKPIV
eukprot:scaffold624_cov150-Cylindrotheca_fusiformis.AAC.8